MGQEKLWVKPRNVVLMAVAAVLLAGGLSLVNADPDDQIAKADKLFGDGHYAEARELYQRVAKDHPQHKKATYAGLRVVVCYLKMAPHQSENYEEAVKYCREFIKSRAGTIWEARGHRMLGNMYLALPHWGTKQGDTFHRAQHKQGTYVQAHAFDKKKAAEHLEQARAIYLKIKGDEQAFAKLGEIEKKFFSEERLECNFDLVGALTRFSPWDRNWHYGWHYGWYPGWYEEALTDDDGEIDADDFREGQMWRWRRAERLPGLKTGPDGRPIFARTPAEYSAKLTPEQKIKFLLTEIEEEDKSPDSKLKVKSLYRRAMLARARYSPELLRQRIWNWHGYYSEMLREEFQKADSTALKDNQTLTLVGDRLAVVDLPADEDVLALLRKVARDFPQHELAAEAQYAIGLYYQTREQYAQALAEYQKLKEAFPKSKWVGAMASQKDRIQQPEVVLEPLAAQLPAPAGANVRLATRNVKEVFLTARKFDMASLIRDLQSSVKDGSKYDDHRAYGKYWWLNPWQLRHHIFAQRLYEKYLEPQEKQITWTTQVLDKGDHRYVMETYPSPVKERGFYLVEARAKGTATVQTVLTVQDLALVEKRLPEKSLYLVLDAATGQPVPGAKLELQETWTEWRRIDQEKGETIWHASRTAVDFAKNDQAVVGARSCAYEFAGDRSRGGSWVSALATAPDGRVAFLGMEYWHHRPWYRDYQYGNYAYVITDRPVYRPNQEVNFKIWVRHKDENGFREVKRAPLRVEIYDSRNNRVYENSHATTDENGGFADKIKLAAEPPLGLYRINISGARLGGNTFRVEEYKKPEFEVTVDAQDHAKLGQKIEVAIKARYYFGAPVADAKVSYKVFREQYEHTFTSAGEWDWLYGWGYGYCWYPYRWFGWWEGRYCPVWYPWWGPPPKKPRELVLQGEGPIAPDGTFHVRIDTAEAQAKFPNQDQQYIVEAEVRDRSRVTITGTGSIKVTRQAFYAFCEIERGYYRTGEDVAVKVRAMTPDNKPVKTKGTLEVLAVAYTDRAQTQVVEKPLLTQEAETDAEGRLDWSFKPQQSGHLRVRFQARDAEGAAVQGNALVWVVGPDFDGKKFRFNDLEILTDKRTYQLGEKAQLLINVNRAGSYVLFSDEVENGMLKNYRLIPAPDKTIMVEVPIKKEHVPNFFVEALAVHSGGVHQQLRELCAPPAKGVLNVQVKTDKAEYRPNEEGNIEVYATDADGEPVKTEIVLSAFDKSVLYIQSELTPEIKQFFHSNKRHHSPWRRDSLADSYGREIPRQDPQAQVYAGPGLPQDWYGSWGPAGLYWDQIGQATLAKLIFGAAAEGMLSIFDQRDIDVGGLGYAEAFSLGREKMRRALPSGSGMALEVAAGTPITASLNEEAKALMNGGGKAKEKDAYGYAGPAPAFAEAHVRKEFADTALWLPALKTDEKGYAKARIKFPENLTTWKINTWAAAAEAFGQGSHAVVTTKNLLVRLQAPRFFVEKDEVVISANVHNYLDKEKTARVSLKFPETLIYSDDQLTQDVPVKANGEARVDWVVKVRNEGLAQITVKALTDAESDAMQMTFPILVHGIEKTVAQSGAIRPVRELDEAILNLEIPKERKPEVSRLEVRFAPSLVGSMLDALPFLVGYPYGCTEQTMSRFLPTVLVRQTLQNTGISLEDIERLRRSELKKRLGRERERHYYCYWENPVFDSDEMERMIQVGLNRLYSFQQDNGGWGWWKDDQANPYLTSYVMFGLLTAQKAGVKVDQNALNRGFDALMRSVDLNAIKEKRPPERWNWYRYDSNVQTQAYVAYVLSLGQRQNKEQLDLLFEARDRLNVYGKCLLVLACHNLGQKDRARTTLRNALQFVKQDQENATAWAETDRDYYWYWWYNDIETNAWLLKALAAVDQKSELGPRLVKWLLNNRQHGYYWRSTRDTALCVAAMSDYATATGEADPDYTLVVSYDDGAVQKEVKVDKGSFFTFDNRFVLTGKDLEEGKHALKLTKKGKGALYYSSYLSYFTKEEGIKGAGVGIKLQRAYFRLQEKTREVPITNADGTEARIRKLFYEKVPLKYGDRIEIGDVVLVQVEITADNNYDYLCFEDYKPAGCEPVELKSGIEWGRGLWAHREFRDERVVFFSSWMDKGTHRLQYRLRATTPGKFHALPAKGYAMYAPDEIKGISDEMVLRIADRKE